MKRLESAAASCGLFVDTKRVTATGESPTHANSAAAPAASMPKANTTREAALAG